MKMMYLMHHAFRRDLDAFAGAVRQHAGRRPAHLAAARRSAGSSSRRCCTSTTPAEDDLIWPALMSLGSSEDVVGAGGDGGRAPTRSTRSWSPARPACAGSPHRRRRGRPRRRSPSGCARPASRCAGTSATRSPARSRSCSGSSTPTSGRRSSSEIGEDTTLRYAARVVPWVGPRGVPRETLAPDLRGRRGAVPADLAAHPPPVRAPRGADLPVRLSGSEPEALPLAGGPSPPGAACSTSRTAPAARSACRVASCVLAGGVRGHREEHVDRPDHRAGPGARRAAGVVDEPLVRRRGQLGVAEVAGGLGAHAESPSS